MDKTDEVFAFLNLNAGTGHRAKTMTVLKSQGERALIWNAFISYVKYKNYIFTVSLVVPDAYGCDFVCACIVPRDCVDVRNWYFVKWHAQVSWLEQFRVYLSLPQARSR